MASVTYNRGPCPVPGCTQWVSNGGLGWTSHMKSHVRRGEASGVYVKRHGGGYWHFEWNAEKRVLCLPWKLGLAVQKGELELAAAERLAAAGQTMPPVDAR